MLDMMRFALAWCQSDVKDEDGHPTQDMLEERVRLLKLVIAQELHARTLI